MAHIYENAITKPTILYTVLKKKITRWGHQSPRLKCRPHRDIGAMLCILSKSHHLSDMEIITVYLPHVTVET